MSAFKRVVIYDPSLIHRFGHFYVQSKSLARALPMRNFECVCLLCDKAGDLAVELSGEVLLNYPAWNVKRLQAYSYAGNWVNANIVSEEGLKRSERLGLDSDDLLLMHSVSPNELMSIYNWYLALPENKPSLFACVHAPAKYYASHEDATIATELFARSLSSWKEIIAAGRVVLSATTQEFAAYMSALGAETVVEAPLIVPVDGIRHHAIPPLPGKLTFAFAGFTYEKGIGKLVEVLANAAFSGIDFKLQIADRGAAERVRDVLSHRAYVQVLAGASDTDAYEQFIGTADAILLPYDPEQYHLRHSSIFMEAIGAGKPVLVTGGTVMARELIDLGMPGVIMKEYTEASLTSAIGTLQSEFSIRKHIAERTAEAYRKKLTTDAYLDRLVDWFDRT